MKFIPWFLVISRSAISPHLLWDALDYHTGLAFVLAYSFAFFSDIFDGIIARRLQISTASLRVADSIADTLLYLSVAACTWLTHPEVVMACRVPLLLTIGGIMLWMVVNTVKYGKFASYSSPKSDAELVCCCVRLRSHSDPPTDLGLPYHTYSAKFWGLSLFAAMIGIYTGWQSELLLSLACYSGLVNIGEEILMTMILPIWQHDVLSFAHVCQLRTVK